MDVYTEEEEEADEGEIQEDAGKGASFEKMGKKRRETFGVKVGKQMIGCRRPEGPPLSRWLD